MRPNGLLSRICGSIPLFSRPKARSRPKLITYPAAANGKVPEANDVQFECPHHGCPGTNDSFHAGFARSCVHVSCCQTLSFLLFLLTCARCASSGPFTVSPVSEDANVRFVTKVNSLLVRFCGSYLCSRFGSVSSTSLKNGNWFDWHFSQPWRYLLLRFLVSSVKHGHQFLFWNTEIKVIFITCKWSICQELLWQLIVLKWIIQTSFRGQN